MTADRDSIFCAAVEIASPQERAAFVAGACGEDASLRLEVERLLGAHLAAGSFLNNPAPELAVTGAFSSAAPMTGVSEGVGSQIGPFKLLQQIGEGGMGAVFMAEQSEPIRRLVALKVIKAGMDSAQIIARFEAERQALALMDHPNIAKVLDAGATPTGRPYFVMELVKGVPITQFCDERRLTLRQRLELMVPVCQAVQHAHQKGIIHRDLKPSNVLVALYDDVPVPKVIDFGVAKATEGKLTERTMFTGFGAIVGTLEYMSPEQAEFNQLDIDTRSDIYSLGVLLYELLTGSTPLDRKQLRQAAMLEVLRLVREETPPRPSARISTTEEIPSVAAVRGLEPAKLSRLMRGELDWIVMKCLEKDRSRRYETANGLARDLARYLDGEPVSACPPSKWYRVKTFARRNRLVLSAAALVMLSLVVGTIVSTWQAIRATSAEQLAEQRLEQETAERERANEAERAARVRLFQSKLSEARATRKNVAVGRRLHSLQVLSEAAELARDLRLGDEAQMELRNEAIASLALTDLRLVHEWKGWSANESLHVSFSPTLTAYARSDRKGAVSIREMGTDCELARLPTTAQVEHFTSFSPDGKLLLTFHNAANTTTAVVWDWERKVELLRLSRVAIRSGQPIQFHPSGKWVAVSREDAVTFHDLQSGQETHRVTLLARADNLRFTPDGTLLAIAVASSPQQVMIVETQTARILRYLSVPFGTITDLAWHPERNLLALGSQDDWTVRLINATNGLVQVFCRGHQAAPGPLQFSPCGNRLISSSWDNTVRLWDVWTGQELCRGTGLALCQSADGQRLAVRRGEQLSIWAVEGGAEYAPLGVGHDPDFARDHAKAQAISPDGHWLAVGKGRGVRLYSLEQGTEKAFLPIGLTEDVAFHPAGDGLFTSGERGVAWWPMKNHKGTTQFGPPQTILTGSHSFRLAVDPCGRFLAVTSAGGTCLIDLTEMPLRPSPLLSHSSAFGVAISPEGRWVASGTHNGRSVKVWDTTTRKLVTTLHPDQTNCVPHFAPDGSLLVSSHTGVTSWKAGDWQQQRNSPGMGEIVRLAHSRDGHLLVVGSLLRVELRDGVSHEMLATLDASDDLQIHRISVSPDCGKLLVSAARPSHSRVWDLRLVRQRLAEMGLDWGSPPYGEPKPAESPDRVVVGLQPFEGHVESVWGMGWSAESGHVVSASRDQTLRVWNAASGELLRAFHLDLGECRSLALTADGKAALTSNVEGSVRLWDMRNGEELRRFEGHKQLVRSVTLSGDGKRFLSGGWDGTIRLWDIDSGKELRQFVVPKWYVYSAIFSPDEKLIYSAGSPGVIRVWDSQTGKVTARYEGHTKMIRALAVTPDGKRLVSASLDGTARVWDTQTGKCRVCFTAHSTEVGALVLLNEGQIAVTADQFGKVIYWSTTTGDILHQTNATNRYVHALVALGDGSVVVAGAGGVIKRLPPFVVPKTPTKDK